MDRAGSTGSRRRAVLRVLGSGVLAGLAAGVGRARTHAPAPPAGLACRAGAWPAWEAFRQHFMSDDGRIIDASHADLRTVSEGQAYAMFFALAANDRTNFEKLLKWTTDNLAQGDLTAHLASWLWGRKADGQWGVLDSNPASDADAWMAYTLSEAGRLWGERRYQALGALLARRIVQQECDYLPGLGETLLPAPLGFHPSAGVWRLNPSYVPMQVVRRLAGLYPDSGWSGLIDSSRRQVIDTAPLGFAPEWVLYRAGKGFSADAETHAEGSYNAIRVYLWAGMLAPDGPDFKTLSARLGGMVQYVAVHGFPPEKVDTQNGRATNAGPAGFSAALVPLLSALHRADLAGAQAARAQTLDAQAPPGYYNQVLTLFGLGWQTGRFRFAGDGTLRLPWEAACAAR